MKPLATLITGQRLPDPLATRTPKEDIINQIVAKTRGSQEERKALAKLIAIWANRYLLNSTDLHALLKKADDPNIRNFGGFVRWAIKDKPRL